MALMLIAFLCTEHLSIAASYDYITNAVASSINIGSKYMLPGGRPTLTTESTEQLLPVPCIIKQSLLLTKLTI